MKLNQIIPSVERFILPLLCLVLPSFLTAQENTNLNVIVIFTDDQGYQDLGCFGSPDIRTPRIDQMAKEGMRLTSFYSANPVCSASRAALLTGCYPKRVLAEKTVLFPRDREGLNPAETTIADMFKEAGYATACVGKWHLGHHPEFLPTRQGFDSYFGIPYSNDMSHPEGTKRPKYGQWDTYWKDRQSSALWKTPLLRDEEIIEHPVDQRMITRRYTDEALSFIRKSNEQSKPFFLYLAHSMPHVPLYLPDTLHDPKSPYPYRDVIEHIDEQVGRIIDLLGQLRLTQNTLVVYTSDNGPWLRFKHHGGQALPLREGKGTTFEGGMRVPCVVWGPGRIQAGSKSDEMMSTIDLLPTFSSLAGVKLKTNGPIDGLDQSAMILGNGPTVRNEFLYYARNLQAFRQGNYKLRKMGKSVQLYDLSKDIGEKENLAGQKPELAQKLIARMSQLDEEVTSGMRPIGSLKQ
ncbi:MAG: arylsulfatase [Opitutae bacterium]|nr:arylsulfatase [Opitutae bacterium]